MLDIRWIRDNADALDRALAHRGAAPLSASLITMDDARRAHIAKVQDAQTRRNAASKEIGAAMGRGDSATADRLKTEMGEIKTFLAEAEAEEKRLIEALNDALARIPNVPAGDVPVGPDESANVELRRVSNIRNFEGKPKEHYELGEALGLMDFERAAKIAGARFTVLTGGLARMERALGQFMLDLHTTEHGYTEVNPPLLVNNASFRGTGQLPKFEEDLFFVPHGNDRLGLIPTAEVPMTNLVAGEILADKELPLRFTALTPCFRSEAGSAGRDTRGMLRQHQFMKVELVSITTPEASGDEHERMVTCAEEVLKRLEIPYRTVVLSTGDMGFGAQKTYDIEAWLPGQDTFREISSCSNCGDFQARRMNARTRASANDDTRFVHTLNGSGVAVGRALIAVMENYQNADGSITVPEVLRPYMGGLAVIGVK
ncbi:MAG: serine--tRNA ligase [Phyllobacteriaceae bacterium]|nr:serine--tRNA ligase [Phyllobacteriaceae bacterium]